MAQALEERGMRLWPDTRLMRLDNPLTERLVASGRLGVIVVNVLRRFTFWRLAVMMVEGRGRRRKAEVRSEPTWVEVQEDESRGPSASSRTRKWYCATTQEGSTPSGRRAVTWKTYSPSGTR